MADGLKPKLVIVGGAPGTGKTTLALELAARAHLPLVTKDDIKESLADVLGMEDTAWSRRLGAATYAVMRAVAARSLTAGGSFVLEANFTRELSEPWLRVLAAHADTRIVICRTPKDRERFAARAGTRHPIHPDDIAAGWPSADDFVIELSAPRLEVDTTGGYRPDLDTIVRFIT